MNLRFHYTKKQEQLQAVSSRWVENIASALPQQLDLLLQQSGCVKRFRGISDVTVLLKGVFLYAVSGLSFSLLSSAMQALELSSISNTAWRKRFSSLAPFFRLLLSSLLASLVSTSVPSSFSTRRVYLIDGSVWEQQGKKRATQHMHVCYSLNEHQVQQVQITDVHTAESFSLFSMKPGDLVLADAQYGTVNHYLTAREQQVDVLLRFSPNHLVLYEETGERLSLHSFLPTEKESSREGFAYLKKNDQLYPVRFIIGRLPEEQAARSRKRKRKKAIRKQQKIKECTLLYAGYVFLLTSLGMEYDREELLHLYRSRWQIELLFKRMKQNLQFVRIRAGGEKYAESLVLIWMIVWLLAEKQRLQGEYYLMEQKETLLFSIWERTQICFRQIKETLELSWSGFLSFEQENVACSLAKQKRRRWNQKVEFQEEILPSLIQ